MQDPGFHVLGLVIPASRLGLNAERVPRLSSPPLPPRLTRTSLRSHAVRLCGLCADTLNLLKLFPNQVTRASPHAQAASSEDMGRWIGVLLAETGSSTDPGALHYDYIDVEMSANIIQTAKQTFW